MKKIFKEIHKFYIFYQKITPPLGERGVSWNLQFLVYLPYRCYILNLIKFGPVVLEKNMLTDEARRPKWLRWPKNFNFGISPRCYITFSVPRPKLILRALRMYFTKYKCDNRVYVYKTFGVRTPLRPTWRYLEYKIETQKWNSLIFRSFTLKIIFKCLIRYVPF